MIRNRVVAVAGAGVIALAGTILGVGPAAAALPAGCTQAPFQATIRCTFTYTGASQSFVVPRGLNRVLVTATGARGGGAIQGRPTVASKITAYIPARGGQRLFVYVGGGGQTAKQFGQLALGGYNGGGAGRPAGGGGASDVRTVGGPASSFASLKSRLIVAGGAGGTTAASRGGDGGRPGESNSNNGAAGGGPGGLSNLATPAGRSGVGGFGFGGKAVGAGGGGGGGFFGGSAGFGNGGGGGGSSFPGVPSPVFTPSGSQVTISYPGPCFPFCFGS